MFNVTSVTRGLVGAQFRKKKKRYVTLEWPLWQAHHARTDARTHARTNAHKHANTCPHPPTHSRYRPGCRCSMGRSAPIHVKVNAPLFACSAGRSVLHSNKQSCVRRGIRDSFECFSRIKKLLGRTETPSCDRMCFQKIRTV